MLSRSLVDILLEVAAGAQVPEADVADGTTIASTRSANAVDPHARPAVVILSGPDLPARAPYAAVRYLDTWYWISNQDFPSKRAFSFLMMFLSLIETGATPQGPVVTLPDELIPPSGGAGR